MTDGVRTYTYDSAGRSKSIIKDGITQFNTYDGLGQRVRKSVANVAIYFVYDESGQLLGEYNQNGSMIREYIWLGNRIVGMYSQDVPNTLLRVHTDHLGTPRAVSQGNGATLQVLWRFEGDAFGDVQPTAVVNNFTMPIRMPGQYYDAEVGISYNYFRDYDPSTGRYVESDPIGLDGGLNTYAYVDANPLAWSDARGLTKGGKKNINTEGFNKNSDPARIKAAIVDAQANMQKDRVKALRAILKVAQRIEKYGLFSCPTDVIEEGTSPCFLHPNSIQCLMSKRNLGI